MLRFYFVKKFLVDISLQNGIIVFVDAAILPVSMG